MACVGRPQSGSAVPLLCRFSAASLSLLSRFSAAFPPVLSAAFICRTYLPPHLSAAPICRISLPLPRRFCPLHRRFIKRLRQPVVLLDDRPEVERGQLSVPR